MGINSLQDLVEYADQATQAGSSLPAPTMILGPSGGGGLATFFNIANSHPALKRIQATPIDESGALNNAVSASLLELAREPFACFLYVSRVPNQIISALDQLGGPNGHSSHINRRLNFQDLAGRAMPRFYFERVKMIETATPQTLRLRGPNGEMLFNSVTLTDRQLYPQLRLADSELNTDSDQFYSGSPSDVELLAVPTQLVAVAGWLEETDTQLSTSQFAFRNWFQSQLRSLQAIDGNFKEVR